ncbi:MAG: translation initiation factor IF-2 [Bacteroidia bacterium]
MSQQQVYRLFKVAKELNVGTSMLVDRLQEKGHVVENSPNTKLSSELYEMLLKEFASEKLMKEKADQLTEKRREDVRTPHTTNKPPTSESFEEDKDGGEADVLTADDLRRILPRQPRRIVTGSTVTPPPLIRKESAEEQRTQAEEPVEQQPEVVPPVEQTPPPPVVTQKEAIPSVEETGGLRILGKIDLDSINKPRDKKQTPPVEQKYTQRPPQQERRPEDRRDPRNDNRGDNRNQPPRTDVRNDNRGDNRNQPPQRRDATPPRPEYKPQDQRPPERKPPVITPQREDEDLHIMRAEDRAPELSGLKVLGKIELPDERKRRKKLEEERLEKEKRESAGAKPAVKPPVTTDEEGDKDKKKRRRKRKRKTATKTDTPVVAKDPRKPDPKRTTVGGKKEKPNEKEVDQSIKTTFSQMGKGASRERQRLRRAKRDADAARREQIEQQMLEDSRVIDVTEFITANEFASLIQVPVNDIIKKSFELGMMISINQRLDAEVLSLIAEEYDYEINFVDVTEEEYDLDEYEDEPEDLSTRNPIITVMGHVDHGKTTLLDNLRSSNVTAQEAGGITQHIGAYEVKLSSGRTVTFLDTPGHEAFTAMRARGAKVTDIVIIVIAADDAVMPQTREAINHAQAANVPMVFAINKVDKPGADPERIKGQLAEMNLLVEDWGGNYQSQEISALKGIGVDDLLEKVILESDMLELKANPNRTATGTVIEARLDKGRGNVATVLVQNGTLKVGDEVLAGIHYGKVRALIDQNGKRIKQAGPSKPVQVLGLGGQPTAGDRFHVFEEEGKAKELGQKRSELYRQQQMRRTNRLTLEEIGRRRALGNFKELNIIIRGDVDGSVEALSGALLKLSTEEVQVNIIAKGVGAITEADINLAIASDAVVIAFNVRPNALARSLAEREEVDIRTYSVIYDAINEVKDALEGLLSPEMKEEITGTAEVKEVFHITKVGNVAGALAVTGKIGRNDSVRIIRDAVVIFDSKLSSLKRFKDDVKEVVNGLEFGFMVENYNDIQPGDILEAYRINEIRRKL